MEDESGFSLIPLIGRTWAPRGRTPIVKCALKHGQRLSAVGGMTPRGKIYFTLHKGTIKSKQVTEYLSELLEEVKGHIVLVWDNHPTHTSKETKRFLEGVVDTLTAFYLPPYFPKLNPIEFLWSHLKWNRMKGFCPCDIGELGRKVRGCVRSIGDKPKLVRSFFRASMLPLGDGAEEKLPKLLASLGAD